MSEEEGRENEEGREGRWREKEDGHNEGSHNKTKETLKKQKEVTFGLRGSEGVEGESEREILMNERVEFSTRWLNENWRRD